MMRPSGTAVPLRTRSAESRPAEAFTYGMLRRYEPINKALTKFPATTAYRIDYRRMPFSGQYCRAKAVGTGGARSRQDTFRVGKKPKKEDGS